MALLHSIHTWHDASILIALLMVLYAARALLTLAKGVPTSHFLRRKCALSPGKGLAGRSLHGPTEVATADFQQSPSENLT